MMLEVPKTWIWHEVRLQFEVWHWKMKNLTGKVPLHHAVMTAYNVFDAVVEIVDIKARAYR